MDKYVLFIFVTIEFQRTQADGGFSRQPMDALTEYGQYGCLLWGLGSLLFNIWWGSLCVFCFSISHDVSFHIVNLRLRATMLV